MKAVVILCVLSISILFAAVFNVDVRQNAVVTNRISHHQEVLTPGMHLIMPGINQVDYIFMNTRRGVFTGIVTLDDGSQAQIGVLVLWHVVNPQIFLANYKNAWLQAQFTKSLVTYIATIINTRAKFTNFSTLNQLNELLTQKETVDNLGIIIDSIKINSLQLLNTSESNSTSIHQESGTIHRNLVVTNSESRASTRELESAYVQAHMLVLQADMQQLRTLSHHLQ